MTSPLSPVLASHLQRHARTLFRIACGFGRQGDAEDIIQTLYARWWRRMNDEAGWELPETRAELFVCVRRAVIDVASKEKRARLRDERAPRTLEPDGTPEDTLHAFDRLQWILARLPAPLAEALTASRSAGRRDDASVARELGLTCAAFTSRLFKARRAAEELASYYELLPYDQANLMAELRYGGRSRSQIAHDLGILPAELDTRSQEAEGVLEKHRRAAS